jgi:hypothetical protein
VEWYEHVTADAKAAYYLTLSEKILDKLTNYDCYPVVRETIDLCWEWVEEKKYTGSDMYMSLGDEDEGFYVISLEYDSFPGDLQAELVYWCVFYAVFFTIKQAYIFDNREHKCPQEFEPINDEFTQGEFMERIRKVDGYQEEWAERLKEYLLANYPAGSDKKIKREEMISLI